MQGPSAKKSPKNRALGPDAPILGPESTDGGREVRNLLKFGNGAPMKNGDLMVFNGDLMMANDD